MTTIGEWPPVLKIQFKNRLLNLVAGGKTLDTYIAKIDDIANEFKLKIVYIKPMPIELPNNLTTQPTNTTLPNTSSKTLITTDPLLFPTLEKRSVEIKIKGSYFNILEFLRNIESLKVAILTSDIKLLSITVPDTSVNKSPIQAEISMKLSAYGPRLKVNQE